MTVDLGGAELYRRSEWSARRPRSRTSLSPMYGSSVHWEGPHMGSFPHDRCDDKVRSIQNFHMDTRGWVDIAYTALVCPHGYVFEGRWVGTRTAANGTTTGNNRAYAVCYLGGIDDPFTAAAQRALRVVLDWLDRHGGAGPGRNCHRDWKPTQCPGNTICSWVKEGQPAPGGSTPSPPPSTGDDDLTPAEKKMLDEIHAWTKEGALGVRADPDTVRSGNFIGRDIRHDIKPGVEKLLNRSDTTLVAPTDWEAPEPVYLTDFMTKTKLEHGGPLHEFVRDVAKMIGRNPNAVRIDRAVLDEIPTVEKSE